ncbi:sensor histidine kinase [Dethiosulfovibrio salsuginis]|uniref:histidine kinase n=1 Tax=Dethiosulfovibrio salsuginis TaxID=561720 RepID=A0A1X7JYE1_9BACT|nr:ATP-binding protein [Dethiosulfovibrio salsuginis]SMG33300.1 two-component system, OmpR family, phosphate regulon sensor histidine kinase PhoR [Dethiosulfovibrio salsuginis]
MKTLKGKILLAVTTVVVLAFVGCWFPISTMMREHITAEAEKETIRQASLVVRILSKEMRSKAVTDELLSDLAKDLECRITLISPSGSVLADTERAPQAMDNHRDRPEIAAALSSGRGSEIRYSRSLETTMVYAAQTLSVGDDPMVVRLSYRLSALDQAIKEALMGLMALLVITALVALSLTHVLIRRLLRPLDRIVSVAGKIASGQDVPFPIMKDQELQRLSGALDDMSRRIHRSIDELRQERGDLETIISSMPVGLILLDGKRSVRIANDYARDLLGLHSGVLLPGRLHPLIEEAAQGGCRSLSMDIPERSIFIGATAKPIESGILLVLQDLTEEHSLDMARRNFIADASHEFQTPLTSIGVTAEFLLEEEDKESREGYLRSILEQQRRLTELVDDMLLLSRLESRPPQEEMEDLDLVELVELVTLEHREHPLASEVTFSTSLPEDALCKGRRDDLIRAIGNVVGNGVKYVRKRFDDRPGGAISISLEDRDSLWVLTVDDNGVGISETLGASIFERFNRGDSSRTRQGWGQGGYGLGLAIAKRIVDSHGGTIELIRSQGGATFEISLPQSKRP